MAAVSESIDDLYARYGDSYRYLVTASGMMASFTMVISGTIVNVAVPDVMGSFGIGQDQAQLMATGFNIAMTTSQLLNAWVIAVLGQRIGFCATLVLFTAGSFIGGLSDDFGMIVVGRVLQGAAAGVIQPLVMVSIFQVFPGDRRGFAMGIYGTGLALAVALGPPFGGMAMEMFDWRFIFFAPLPLVGGAFIMGLVFMPSVRGKDKIAFDWTGYGLLVVALYCVMTGLTDGQREGWSSNYTVGLFIIALITGSAFVYSQLRRKSTLVDMTLFSNRQFAAAAMIAFIFGTGNFASVYAIPVFAQLVQGMTPMHAGLVIMPAALLVATALPITGRLADTVSPRTGIIFGLLFFAGGTALMADSDVNTTFLSLMMFTMISRFGMSFTMPFIMNTALGALPADKLNAGGGTVNFCRQLGGSLGTNAWVVFLQMRSQFYSEALTATQTSDNKASRELLEGVGQILGEAGVPAAVQQPGALHYLGQVVRAQADTLGFQDGFWVLVIAFLLAMIPALMLAKRRR